jgi:hypothetical protein
MKEKIQIRFGKIVREEREKTFPFENLSTIIRNGLHDIEK